MIRAEQRAPVINVPEVATVTNTMEVVTLPAVAQPISLTIEEVLVVEHDMENNNSAGRHQVTLSIRGTEIQPAFYMDESLLYNWRRLGSRTPLPRGKVLPKLAKMGIPMTILNGLSSTQLSEVMCLICVILYDTRAQKKDVPYYIPGQEKEGQEQIRVS